MSIPKRYDWAQAFNLKTDGGLLDKDRLIRYYTNKMLITTQSMFKYENLPKTIPRKDLELILQVNGYAVFTRVNDELYALYGGLGGEYNAYYMPTQATVSNPYLNYSAVLNDGVDCIIVKNDSLYNGLLDTIGLYATLLAEIDLSIQWGTINHRIENILTADNDNANESGKEFFKKIVKGEEYGLISTNAFFEGVRNVINSQHASLVELIELHNYVESTFYMSLGIASNWNNKREALSKNEINADNDMLIPFIEDMRRTRQEDIERVNQLYGTNITVSLDSVWEKTYLKTLSNNDNDEVNDDDEIETNET